MWEWWRAYGDAYAHPAQGLLCVVVERGTELVAALPLYVGRRASLPFSPRVLRFLSTGEQSSEETCAAPFDLLYRGDEAASSARLIASALNQLVGRAWDACELSALSPHSPLTDWVTTFGPARPMLVGPAKWPSNVARLDGGYDAYLMRLSKNSREQARRLVRSLDAAGVSLEFALDAAAVDLFFAELVELHQARWATAGQAGLFASKRFTAFHLGLAHQLAQTGGAVLARLVHQGRTWAVVQGYVAGSKFDYYLAGTRLDEDAPIKSPGIGIHQLLKRHLVRQGISAYDYMPGPSRLKAQYSTEERPMVVLRLDKRGLGSMAYAVSKVTARAVNRAIRLTNGLKTLNKDGEVTRAL